VNLRYEKIHCKFSYLRSNKIEKFYTVSGNLLGSCSVEQLNFLVAFFTILRSIPPMSVSGGQFSNLDNFKSTPMTGPDATRKLERPSAAMAREARKLRRAGVMRGYEALMIDASRQRLGEGGMKSYETKRAEEDAMVQETNDQNALKKSLIDRLTTPAVTEPPAMLRRPVDQPAPDASIPPMLKRPADAGGTVNLPAPMGENPSATGVTLLTTKLGEQANSAMSKQDPLTFRKGLDRALGMAKNPAEVGELKTAALASGVSEDQFQRRQDFWKKKNSTALGRLTR